MKFSIYKFRIQIKFKNLPNLEFLPTPHNMYNQNFKKIHFLGRNSLKKLEIYV